MAKQDILVVGIVVFSLLLAFFIIRVVFSKYLSVSVPKNQVAYSDASGIDFSDLKKISAKPLLLGFESKFISDEELYFDAQYLYAVDQQKGIAKFKLDNISRLTRTSTQVNNHTVWQLDIEQSEKVVIFKFTHNYSIWNTNFKVFYDKLKEINPSVVKSNWSLWKM